MVRKSSKNMLKSVFTVDFDIILVVILLVIAILLICFMNNKFNKQAEKFFTENRNINVNSPNRVLLFFTTWCPHSQRFLKEDLGRLVSTLENHGKENLFLQVDISDRDNQENADLAKKYSVSSVPTLVLDLNGEHEVISSFSDEDFERLVQRL
tara:strand:+ start:41 stop:499 length:459 start_codon:yes stop_codon:yes gene_type:complete